MGVTTKLLELYRVDQQLRGLTGRLKTAEAYLAEQDKLLSTLKSRHDTLAAQLKTLEASARNDEVEAKGIESRIEMLRERMNTAQTNKEHQALNTEVATLKADKGLVEERALASMQKLEKSKADAAALSEQLAEREKVREIARRDRDERQQEIAARLDELNRERAGKLDGLGGDALAYYNQRLNSGAPHVMAALEEMDRRNLEYSCGACYTVLPIELVSVLLKRGDLTKCPSCKVILYMEAELKSDISSSQEKKKGGGTAKPKGTRKKKTVPEDAESPSE